MTYNHSIINLFKPKGKSFSYLDKMIQEASDEIVLESDIILKNSEASKYLEGIELRDKDLIIDGKGHFIDAKSKSKIFNIYRSRITFKNIIFRNGYCREKGGAIESLRSTLNISGCIFESNKSESDRGGAIHSGFDEVVIEKSRFSDNSSDLGGAIRSWESKMSVSDTLFSKNSARKGGAIYHTSGDLTITHSEFSENDSKKGGAILTRGDLKIKTSKFTENNAFRGGAVYNLENTLNIDACDFNSNRSQCGGAIFNRAEISVNDTLFESNDSNFAGEIFNCCVCRLSNSTISKASHENVIKNTGYLEISHADISGNASKHIISNSKNSRLRILKTKIADNFVSDCVILNEGIFASVDDCLFENNLKGASSKNIVNSTDIVLNDLEIIDSNRKISNTGYVAIRNLKTDLDCEGTAEFIEGEGFDFGYLDQLIHESDSKTVTLTEDIRIERYEKGLYEFGIPLDIDGLVIDGAGAIIDAAGMSRIFEITGKDITLKNITFKNGHTANPLKNSGGGALRIDEEGKLSVEKCDFISNSCKKDGGAIDNWGSLKLESCRFLNNSSNDGGAISNNSSLSINESHFENNTANENGGAIANKEHMIIQKSDFTSNTAQYGGALRNDKSMSIVESHFEKNKAGTHGGAIFDYKCAFILRCCFKKNCALLGSGIYTTNYYSFTNELCIIDECKFEDNSEPRAVYFEDITHMFIDSPGNGNIR